MHVGNIIWKIIFPVLHCFWQKTKCFAFHSECFPYYCRKYSGSRKRALTMAKTGYICHLFIAKRMIKLQRIYFGYFSKNGLNKACHFWGCIHKWFVVSYTMYVTLCIVVRRPCRPRSDRIFVSPLRRLLWTQILWSSDPLTQHAEHLLLSHKCLQPMC